MVSVEAAVVDPVGQLARTRGFPIKNQLKFGLFSVKNYLPPVLFL